MNNIEMFRKEFLGANTWAQRKEGVPLDLLDKLTTEELKIAENDLIEALSLGDTWPILGVGHIKSKDSLPKLYDILTDSKKSIKITIAYAIFQICQDSKMIDIVLEEIPKTADKYELIGILYLLPDFKDERIIKTIDSLRASEEYLIAYNAKIVFELSKEKIAEKFRNKGNPQE